MAETHRHFILTLPYANEAHSRAVCVGEGDTQRTTLPTAVVQKVFLKTTQRLINNYLYLNPTVTLDMLFPSGQCVEYTDEQIKIELAGTDWTIPFEIPE